MDKVIEKYREQIIKMAQEHGIINVRVFGSRSRNEARPNSDLDLLVTLTPEASLLDRIALSQGLEELLHIRVEVLNDKAINRHLRDRILKEAKPL